MPRRLTAGEAADVMVTLIASPTALGANQLLATPGVGWKWVVYGYQIANNGAGVNVVKFTSAATDISSPKSLAISGGTNVGPNPEVPLFECAENEALGLNLSVATAVGIDYQVARVRV